MVTKLAYEPKLFNEFFLEVDEIHKIKVWEYGNPKGQIALVVHGGPGSGCSPYMQSMFNPKIWRIILFDQRGSGQSIPKGEIKNNTTGHLVEDIEKIRQTLKIERFTLVGGSWGSTLALAYAIHYKNQVESLILRGIFLGRKKDIDWFYEQGANKLHPERWEHYYSLVPKGTKEIVKYYYQQICLQNSKQHMLAWAQLEAKNLGDHVDQSQVDEFMDEKKAYALSRIETHYFYHRCFLQEKSFMEGLESLNDLKISIIHGENDMICHSSQAQELFQCLPNANFLLLKGAGHAGLDPLVYKTVVSEIKNHQL